MPSYVHDRTVWREPTEWIVTERHERLAVRKVHRSWLAPPGGSERPGKVNLAPGQRRTVRLTVDVASLASWDNPSTGWTVHKGTYRVYVGDSSRHLPTQADITID
jgi:hypothetical protein